MPKKFWIILIIVVLAFSSIAAATIPQPCLNPGSYLLLLKENQLVVMKMDAAVVKEVKVFTINMPGQSADGTLTADGCYAFFSWAKPGKPADIYRINPSNGWNLWNITRTPDTAEWFPVLNRWDNRVAFEEIHADSPEQLVSVYKDGTGRTVEAQNAFHPAWDLTLSYTDGSGHIYPTNLTGTWHAYLPDRSGLLVKSGDEYTVWPHVGPAFPFGNYRGVALRPEGNLAAVIPQNGSLWIQPLDARFVPAGAPIRATGMTGLTSVIWITVK